MSRKKNRKKRESEKEIAKPYVYDQDHKAPVTRREFVAQGIASGFALSMMPSLLTMLFKANAAEAAVCPATSAAPGLLPFLVLDMAGGLAMSGNFVVGKSLGAMDYLTSYGTLGIPDGDNPKNVSGRVDSRFGAPFHSTLSHFYAGMLSVMSAGAQANTRIMTICNSSQDDTAANQLSPLILVSKAGLLGTRLPIGLSNSGGAAGGNSQPPLADSTLKPLAVGSAANLVSALSMGDALASLSNAQRVKIASAASKMSAGQAAKFANMSLGSQFAALAECGYGASVNLINDIAAINPTANTNVQGVYGVGGAAGANATVVYNTLVGNTGPGAVVVGGCDYHNQGQTTTDAKDRECGAELGRMLELAHRLGKPAVVAGISDGSCSSNPGTRMFTSDSGNRGMSFLACYKPAAAPTLVSSQIGSFTDGQGVNSVPFFASNPSMVAYALLANYLKLSGRMDLFTTLVPIGAFPVERVDEVLGFG